MSRKGHLTLQSCISGVILFEISASGGDAKFGVRLEQNRLILGYRDFGLFGDIFRRVGCSGAGSGGKNINR